ncbi:UNVERIFIED_CONTAM: hypothetical protein GTU68_063878 [Idotea baltica]|nr:hypothetical protein [Idotea baltica]
MNISYEKLKPETLQALIENFVNREGTDYGTREYSLAEKVGHVREQLRSGKATISFNPEDETCTIVSL